jgi:hypothetical protein
MKKLLLFLLAALCTLPASAGSPVTIQGPVYGNGATVSPLGELRVENPASQLFLDTFSLATLDTVNRWSVSNGGGGVSPTNAVGATVLSGGTTVNGFSKLTSLLPTGVGLFVPSDPGYLLFKTQMNVIPALGVTSGLADWGLGTTPATPTIASPVTQCVCFEETTTGHLAAVVYQTGTRVLIADLTNAGYAPTDTAAHKYFIYFRGDITYWAIDDKDNVVANFQTGASGPDNNLLPVLFQVVSNSAVTAPTLQVNGVSLGDTSHTATTQNLYNGFTYENQRSNSDCNSAALTLTAQGAGTVNSIDQINTNGRGLIIPINTTVDAAGAYTVAVQGKDIVSGTYYTITAPASTPVAAISGAIAATGFQQLTIYPGTVSFASTPTLGGAVDMPLPRTWRLQAVVTTGPITATVGCTVIN